MTTQQNNMLISMMLNGKLISYSSDIDSTDIMVFIYEDGKESFIYLKEDGWRR